MKPMDVAGTNTIQMIIRGMGVRIHTTTADITGV
jgi:hypothetical protein